MWLVSLVAVIFCAYFLASMTAGLVSLKLQGEDVSLLISPPTTEKGEEGALAPAEDPEALKPVIERNVFNSKAILSTGEPEEEEETTEVLTGEAVPTSLSIKLLSTFSVGGGMDQRSTCVISGGQAKEDVYTVNDTKQFAPETKVLKILYDRVEFSNKGRLEYVLLEDFAKRTASHDRGKSKEEKTRKNEKEEPAEEVKIEETGEGKFVIDRAEIEAAMANMDKLYTQVRAVPHFKEGNPDGLKLLSVRSGSIFSKLGLKRGDILKKINGNELDIKKGLELFNQLKTESTFVIEVERKGTVFNMEYEIK